MTRSACIIATFAAACLATAALGKPPAPATVDALVDGFVSPPAEARPMVRWWWFGPDVTDDELRREMVSMRDGGFGGFEVQPTYPLSVNGPGHDLAGKKFLSTPFLDAMKFTAQTAKEIGLRMDLTLGSGWPYGGPQFTVGEGAGRLRVVSTQVQPGETHVDAPKLKAGEALLAAFLDNGELPIGKNGVDLPANAAGRVSFFVAGRTGMQVKRPAAGAEGNVIDHLNPAVVGKFIGEVGAKEVAACGPNPPHAVFCDSLESYNEDWTGDLLDEFKKRRGYDLRPLLPALTGDIGPATSDIRHDWGRTLTEVFGDSFMKPLRQFSHEHGTQFRVQAYGTPSAGLMSYADADLPEGEGYQWRTFRASRYASSASHLMGVPVTSSEAFTWLHPPVFRATPLDIKAEADRHFLQGINQLVCHGWPYTPPDVGPPGWSFYVPAVFNAHNPWYGVMADVNRYLARISFLLRQGQPANGVAIYLADDDAWANFTPGKVSLSDGVGKLLGPGTVSGVLDAGFNFDFLDDGMLERFGHVDGGRLVFGAQSYKAVLLAGVERMPLKTLRQLDTFARNGGLVIATRRVPDRAPGHAATDAERQETKELSRRLFLNPDAPGLFVPDESSLTAALAGRAKPDVTFEPRAPQVGFVHRHLEDAELYFLANTGNQPLAVTATFDVQGKVCHDWNALTGDRQPLAVEATAAGSRVALHFEPYGSTVLVWSPGPAATSQPLGSATEAQEIDLGHDWSVQFGPNAAPVPMPALEDWTASASTRSFSGVCTYTRNVTVAQQMLSANKPIFLDFGKAEPEAAEKEGGPGTPFVAQLAPPVREAAIVWINGVRVGSVWCPPYRLDVSGKLVAGENTLRIDVANTAVNAIAAQGFPNYDVAAITAAFGRRFDAPKASAFTPQPSGLLGPVTLQVGK